MSIIPSKIFKIFFISSITIAIAIFSFEAAYKFFDIGNFRAPLSLNIKLHSPNSVFTVKVSNNLRARSNTSLVNREFTIRTGKHREIIGKKNCLTSQPEIFALGASTTEQKLVEEGKRWVDILNTNLGTKNFCIRNYGYGGINLISTTDTLYFLSSIRLPHAVILMSNATDVGHLLRYGDYKSNNSHYSKNRIIYNGAIKKYKQQTFPGLNHLLRKIFGQGATRVSANNNSTKLEKKNLSIVDLYIEQFLKLKRQLIANDIPLIYVAEPRILDLKDLPSEQASAVYKTYKESGVEYQDMSSLHLAVKNAVQNEIMQSGIGCFLDTAKLNSPEFLYDEGHLNEKGSKLLAGLIEPVLNNLSTCL